MNHKRKILWSIGASVIGFLITVFLENLNRRVFDDLQQFLGLFSIISFIVLVILYFLLEQVFISWFKFARIYIPIALVLAVGGGATSNGSDLFNTDAEFFTTFFSVIFVVISIVLIIRAHRRLKRQAKAGSLASGG